MGVENLVVAPKAMGQGGKQQKTDRRDSGELTDALERYLRGQDRALSVVGVPSVEQEQKRALIRYHRQIMADRNRYEARGKGLLCAQGIEVYGLWWEAKGWEELKHHPRLKEWMKELPLPRFFGHRFRTDFWLLVVCKRDDAGLSRTLHYGQAGSRHKRTTSHAARGPLPYISFPA